MHYHDIREFQERERERLHERGGQNYRHERDFLLFFKGKCTPLNFTWKVEAVKNQIAQSTVNVGKLMRVHIVKQIQSEGSCFALNDCLGACGLSSASLGQEQPVAGWRWFENGKSSGRQDYADRRSLSSPVQPQSVWQVRQ